MEKIQERYLNPRANRYSHKSATDVFTATMNETRLQNAKKKARFKSASFNRSKNIDMFDKDAVQTQFKEATKNFSADERSSGDLLSSQLNSSACINACNVGNDIKLIDMSDNGEKQNTKATRAASKDNGAKRASVRTSVEEYLRNNCEVCKLPDIEENETRKWVKNVKSSTIDIADMLTSLNIGSFELHDDLEKRNDACVGTQENTREDDKEHHCSNTAIDTARRTPVDTVRNQTVSENTSVENSLKFVDAKPAGTSKQSNATSCEDDAFIKIRLNVPDKSAARDKLSQMLQSEYLKKNLLL